MRVRRVITNETCDLRCSFCNARRSHERSSVAGAEALRRRIEDRDGARELVLTGGEPTQRDDLPRIVAFAKQVGDARVVLETHGASLDAHRVQALSDAGLDVVRLHLPGWGDTLDRVVGRPGAHRRVQRTARAFARAGVTVEGTVPIVRATVPIAAGLLDDLAADVAPSRIWIRFVLEAPDPDALVGMATATAAVEALADAGRRTGVAVQLDPTVFVPPCAFDRPGRVSHLYALNPGGAHLPGHQRHTACRSCSLADRCPGPRAGADFEARPITDDRLRRRLTIISTVDEQIDREVVTHEVYRRADGTAVPAAIVRIHFHCNQSCRFCFVSTHLPPPTHDRIAAAIDEIGAKQGVLALSGGEPTLSNQLESWVRRAKSAGVCEVELQTNAVRLAMPGRAAALADAGVDTAFVSLHGATASTSDGITGAPGTHAQTLAGIDRLVDAGIRVRLNFVLCTPNHVEFPDFVDLVATRWPSAEINVSFVGMSTDLVPTDPELVPRYRDVIPSLTQGLHRAAQAGLSAGGFESMCGIPLCLVPGDPQPFAALAPVEPGYDGGEFVHPAACAQCVLKTRCFGLRRGYARIYGVDELRPIRSLQADATS